MTNNKRTIFQWIVCFVGVLVIQENALAQISEGGIPPSFQFQTTLRSRAATIQAPVTFNVSDLIMEDERQAGLGTPLRIATLIDVQYNPANAGVWNTLPDGTKIWQLNLQAKGAIALSLYYADFYIPEGGKLFIYNADKTHILGAYTHRTFPSGGRFANESVAGDELTLEYVASPDGAMPRIEIEAIGYVYKHPAVQNGSVSLRRSAPCEVNINCEEGDAWQNQKKGVCYIEGRIGSGTYIFSGSLVNNTAQDLKPYILTAYHNAFDRNNRVASEEDMKQWRFYFHYEREGCSNDSSPADRKSMSGCTKIVATTLNKESDGLLVLLNMPVPEYYNVYYNGWDKRNQPAQSGVGIHHPEGDYKKISTFLTPANHVTWNYAGYTSDTNAHWNVRFDATLNGHGVTEGGSSGSPLFNENKLIVGTLSGGSSECALPHLLNLYGKMSYHWDRYNDSDSTRMDIWLDPINSGVDFLAGRYHQSQMPAPFNLKAVYDGQTVILTWNAPDFGNPLMYYVYNNNIRIGETALQTFTDVTPQFGTQTYSVSAVYANGSESALIYETVTAIEYNKAPTDVSVMYTTSQQIAVRWEPPVYEQTIYWGESNAVQQVTLSRLAPFFFGQTWNSSDIWSFHRRTITAVKFIPVRNNTYDVYIAQGNRTYRQTVSNPVAGRTNTIQLNMPFVIDGTESLIVSMHVTRVSSSEDDYPAVCDDGPAVPEKGNIYSFNGRSWSSLNVEFNNFNFFVAATVSSVERDIPVIPNNPFVRSVALSNAMEADIRTASSEEVSLRSIRPAAFIEPTGYYIYRDNVRITTIPPIPRLFIDTMPSKETFYQVSALYGNNEGQRSNPVSILPTSNMPVEPNDIRIYPNIFTSQIELAGHERISKIEVYSATGALAFAISNPDRTIYTGSLQPGVYFFRIYTNNDESFKVLRGIKQR